MTPEELPEHIKRSIEFYEKNYEFSFFHQDNTGASSKLVSAEGLNTCRYCEKSSPEVQFKTDCHVLLEARGNRNLFAEDECDSCNKHFGSGIENHFAKWSLPYRVVSCIRGKRVIRPLNVKA